MVSSKCSGVAALRAAVRSSSCAAKPTYMTAVGEVEVERWLYKDRTDPAAHAVAAMDLRLGVVEGSWTTKAAKQASWVVTQMTPKRAADWFSRGHDEALEEQPRPTPRCSVPAGKRAATRTSRRCAKRW